MNNQPNIQVPIFAKSQTNVQFRPAPNLHPVQIAKRTATGEQITILGGQTRLEAAAVQIAAAAVSKGGLRAFTGMDPEKDGEAIQIYERIAFSAVSLAMEVLRHCEQAQNESASAAAAQSD